jgi:hypothetical protein
LAVLCYSKYEVYLREGMQFNIREVMPWQYPQGGIEPFCSTDSF